MSGDNRPPFESRDLTVSSLATLEKTILDQIAAAGDEAALEAVRVASRGKKGSISALLATLGKMSPDERKTQGAAINLAKDNVTQALSARRDILKSAALDARLASETIDVTLPLREAAAEQGRIHPLSQVFESCQSGASADVQFGDAVEKKCESDFLAGLKPPQTRVYEQEMQVCDNRHRNQSGTMYRSFNAFCRARVAQHYSQQALKAAGSKPLR